MKRNTCSLILTVLLAVAMAAAQGPRGQQNGNAFRTQSGSGLDMSRQTTVQGVITAINIGYGLQYPSIQVGQTVVRVAPVWFLLENDFELKAGDNVTVTAAPGANDPAVLHAVSIVNQTNHSELALRDESGYPLWQRGAGGGGRGGNGAGGNGAGSGRGASGGQAGTSCVDPATITAFQGTVVSVSMGVGLQMPTLVVKKSDGVEITVKIGPERILQENDFELAPGEAVTVKMATASCTGEYIALQLTNAAGVIITLRDDNGKPAW